jgi:hypothetical protein
MTAKERLSFFCNFYVFVFFNYPFIRESWVGRLDFQGCLLFCWNIPGHLEEEDVMRGSGHIDALMG